MSEKDFERKPVEKPVETYIDSKLSTGKKQSTVERYEDHVTHFLEFLEEHEMELTEVDEVTAERYGQHAREQLADTTYRHRIIQVADMWDVLARHAPQEYGQNPFQRLREAVPDSRDARDTHKRHISHEDMRDALRDTTHPQHKAILMLLVKTGCRCGELLNLDLRDINLDDAQVGEMYDELGVTVREELQGMPNSMYISAEPEEGEVYNGEERPAGNKRRRGTCIPIDEELQAVLKRWLAVRPSTSSSALLTSVVDNWGERFAPQSINHIVRKWAEEHGFRERGDSGGDVSPHYFRHWLTSYLSQETAMDPSAVDYIRGDRMGDGAKSDYIHAWYQSYRPLYLETVPKFY